MLAYIRDQDDRHARGIGGEDAVDRIFECQAVAWGDAEALSGKQVGFRVRLSFADLIAGNKGIEVLQQPVAFELASREPHGGRGGNRLRDLVAGEEFYGFLGAVFQRKSVVDDLPVALAGARREFLDIDVGPEEFDEFGPDSLRISTYQSMKDGSLDRHAHISRRQRPGFDGQTFGIQKEPIHIPDDRFESWFGHGVGLMRN